MENTLASRLRYVRGKESREKFANRIGVSPRALANYEYGEREPKGNVIAQICARLGIEANWLLSGSGPMYRTKQTDETADMSAVLAESNLQPVENINIEKKKTADMSAVLGVQRELTEALKQGMEFQKQVMTLTQENAELRVQAERQLSRIRELERENEELRRMRKGSSDLRSQYGRDVG